MDIAENWIAIHRGSAVCNWLFNSFTVMKQGRIWLLWVGVWWVGMVQGQKSDYVWLTGANLTSGDTANPKYSITQFDFKYQPPIVYRKYRSLGMSGGASAISDKSGTLQFYTDGFLVKNWNNDLMSNGDSLNPGQVGENNPSNGYPANHGSWSIPFPENDSVYYLFHCAKRYGVPLSALIAYNDKLYYTIVDMRLNNGLGDVTQKNKLIKEDTLVGGSGMAACKHANGRDWWIIMQELRTNCFYEYLLTPDGIGTISKQCIGDTLHWDVDRGSNLFSPDGSKYIWANPYENLNILDFDRCTGALSNFIRIKAADSLGASIDGAAVSSNSRYLYLTTGTELRQFDLQSTNIEQSEIIIDNLLQGNPQSSTLYCQLAPDGKVYINTGFCDTFLHVVNNPDLPGMQCNFVRNQVILPTYNCYYLPYYPNYRLGPLAGSACDSLPHVGIEVVASQGKMPLRIYPNPTLDAVTVDYGYMDWNQGEAALQICNQLGQTVFAQLLPLYSGFQKLNVAGFPSGLYQVFIKRKGVVVAAEKLVKE